MKSSMLWICIVSTWVHLLDVEKLIRIVFVAHFMPGDGMDLEIVMTFRMQKEYQTKQTQEAGLLMKKMERFMFGLIEMETNQTLIVFN